MNQNIKEELGESKPQEENVAKTFSNNVPAESVPRITAYDYKDVVNKLQNYNSLSAQEQVDVTRAVNTKKKIRKT